jgi:hypothetical protein
MKSGPSLLDGWIGFDVSLAPESLKVEVYNGGTLMDERTIPGAVFMFEADDWPIIVSYDKRLDTLGVALAGQPLSSRELALEGATQIVSPSGVVYLVVGYGGPTMVTIPGGPTVIANLISVSPINPLYEYDGLDRLVVTGNGLGGNRLAIDAVRREMMLDSGELIRSLGGAAVAHEGAAPDDVLTIANIGSSGEDGVRIDLANPSTSASVKWAPLGPPSGLPAGTSVKFAPRGMIVGFPNEYFELGSLVMDGELELHADMSALGATSVTVRAYNQGALVGEVTGLPNGIVGSASEYPIGASSLINQVGCPNFFELRPNTEVVLGAPNKSSTIASSDGQGFATAGGVITADLLEFAPENPTLVPTEILSMNLKMTRVPYVMITKFGTEITTAVDDTRLPARTWLHPAVPNPFGHSTNLGFELAQPGRVALHVYDLRGRRVATVLDGDLQAGQHTATWNSRDTAGRRIAPGIYFVKFLTPGSSQSRKVVLLP